MAGLRAISERERPLVNGEHGLLEPGPATVLPLLGTPVIPAGTQRRSVQRREP